ncbi:unnamed protein product, partial [Closterium sp. NIES-54]
MYADIYSSLVRGDKDGKVLACTGLDELKFRRGDLKKVLAIHGLADGSSKSRKDVLASLVGMRLWLPLCELSKAVGSTKVLIPPVEEVNQDLLAVGWLDSPVNELLKVEMKATGVAVVDLSTQAPESQIEPGSPRTTTLKGFESRLPSVPEKSLVAEAVAKLLKMEQCPPVDLAENVSKSDWRNVLTLTRSRPIKREAAEISDTGNMMVISIPRPKLVNSSTSMDDAFPGPDRSMERCGDSLKKNCKTMRGPLVQLLEKTNSAGIMEQRSKCGVMEAPKSLEQQLIVDKQGKTSVHAEELTDMKLGICNGKIPVLATAPQIKPEPAEIAEEVFKRPASPRPVDEQISGAAAVDWVSFENQVLRLSLHLQIDTNEVKPNSKIGRTVIMLSLKGVNSSHRNDITKLQPLVHVGRVMRTVKKSHLTGICSKDCM